MMLLTTPNIKSLSKGDVFEAFVPFEGLCNVSVKWEVVAVKTRVVTVHGTYLGIGLGEWILFWGPKGELRIDRVIL